MKNLLFTGSGTALVTPFTSEGVDYNKLGELIEWQIAEKTDALIICGTTGEASTMPDAEHKSVIKYAVEKAAGRIPVIAGTGSNDTEHCLDLSRSAKADGADGLLLVTPYYNKTTPQGLIEHFKYIASNVNIPIILYNVPSRTGMSMTAATCKALSQIPNIVGIKEASGNISLAAEIAAACGDDLPLYSGNDDMVLPILSLGGKGVISVLSNVMPRETHDMCEAYFSGNAGAATKMQLDLLELINGLFIEVNPIPVKTALNLMGKNVGLLRRPLCDMADVNLGKLKEILKKYGLI